MPIDFMTDFYVGFLIVLITVLGLIVICLARTRRPPRPSGYQKFSQRPNPDMFTYPQSRPVGKHPALAAPYGRPRPVRDPTLIMFPRNLSHINAQRRLRGKAALNEKGFKSAIAQAPVKSDRMDDWFTYLILYEVMFSNHTGLTPDMSVVIRPNEPFNGHGGTFGGAGASGSWGDDGGPTGAASPDPSPAAPQASGCGLLDDAGGPATAPSDYPTSSPDPAPSYSPDPSPSSDSSPSYSSSSDSSSSSSYDSGSSSSFDSGSSSSF